MTPTRRSFFNAQSKGTPFRITFPCTLARYAGSGVQIIAYRRTSDKMRVLAYHTFSNGEKETLDLSVPEARRDIRIRCTQRDNFFPQ